MGENFKFQVQDSFLEYVFFLRFKKRIAVSEKKSPLVPSDYILPLLYVFTGSISYSKCNSFLVRKDLRTPFDDGFFWIQSRLPIRSLLQTFGGQAGHQRAEQLRNSPGKIHWRYPIG